MIAVGDHDLMREEHTVELYLNIPNAYLFVVPGATHGALVEKPNFVNSVIVDFLLGPYVDLERFVVE